MSHASSNFAVPGGQGQPGVVSDESKRKDTRKRRDRSGTRCVAALNPDQLARKRANDREAQRAIRQRTKEHIETLERRIRNLSEGHDSEKELDEVRRRNSELEAELAFLKESLTLPIRDISPSSATYLASESGSNSLQRSASFGDAPLYTSSNSPVAPTTFMHTSFPSSVPAIPWSPHLHGTSTPVSEGSRSDSIITGYREIAATDVVVPMISATTAWMDTEASNPFHHVDVNMSFPGGDSDSNCSSCPSPREQPMPNHLLDNIGPPHLTNMPPLANSLVELDAPGSFGNQSPQPAWSIPLRLVPPTSPFDSILLGLIQRQKSLANNGADETVVTGPHQPSMKALLYSDHPNNKSHPISTVISNLLHKTALRDLPEKAAILYLMYRFTQWQILPSSSTYNALPDWQTPRVTQLITPHPAWVSQIIWGKLRDKVIESQEMYATDEFQYLYMRSLNVHWPFRGVDAFLSQGDEVTATDAFERHVRTLSNWSLDEPFARRYPELRDDCKFTEYAGYELG